MVRNQGVEYQRTTLRDLNTIAYPNANRPNRDIWLLFALFLPFGGNASAQSATRVSRGLVPRLCREVGGRNDPFTAPLLSC
jgi:hypothetical protein